MKWFGIISASILLIIILLALFARAGRETTYISDNFFTSYSEMTKIANNMNTDCSTCHTLGKLWLTEKGLKAREMMRMSVDMNMKCEDCHKTLDTYTKVGEFSKKWMLPLPEKFTVSCLTCHHHDSKKLTTKGKKARIMLDFAMANNYTCIKCHMKDSNINGDDIYKFGLEEKDKGRIPSLSLKAIREYEIAHLVDTLALSIQK